MSRKFRWLKRLNICTKYRACIFWAVLNILFGLGILPYVYIDYTFPYSILAIAWWSGINLIISGVLLLVGVLKGLRHLVVMSLIFCTLGIIFVHWLIITLVLYIIFSLVVYNYYQVDMAADDRYRVPRRYS